MADGFGFNESFHFASTARGIRPRGRLIVYFLKYLFM